MGENTRPVLKGNFEPRTRVTIAEEPDDLTAQFEREALKRLGGSIAFVSRKEFVFGLNKGPESGKK